jgi:hypothetical protein
MKLILDIKMRKCFTAAVLMLCGLIMTTGALAQTSTNWTMVDLPYSLFGWYVASSADGTNLAAASEIGIYTSHDAGNTWNYVFTPNNEPFSGISSSADGTLLAAMQSGNLWISGDSGATWNLAGQTFNPASQSNWAWTNNADWKSAAVCGSAVVAVGFPADSSGDEIYGGVICQSTDLGTTWNLLPALVPPVPPPTPTTEYELLQLDGLLATAQTVPDVFAATAFPAILGTTDLQVPYGTGYLRSLPFSPWNLACSADGSTLLAGTQLSGSLGPLYLSKNGGTSWTPTLTPSDGSGVECAAASSDGTKLVAASVGSSEAYPEIYISTNSGGNWHTNFQSGDYFISLASSADGSRLIAGGDAVFILNQTTQVVSNTLPAKLQISVIGRQVQLSWNTNQVLPLTLYTINDLLNPTNWVAITNKPLTINNQFVITLPVTNQMQLFRLQE